MLEHWCCSAASILMDKGHCAGDRLLNTVSAKRDAQTELTPVQFDSFPETDETIRVVVTGDLPPVDYIGEDGVPAGFNTAVLAEIGRRLGVNIELVSAHTGARSLALSSHVADAVFWYMMDMPGTVPDAPDGVLFSEPYLDWDLWLHVRKTAQ